MYLMVTFRCEKMNAFSNVPITQTTATAPRDLLSLTVTHTQPLGKQLLHFYLDHVQEARQGQKLHFRASQTVLLNPSHLPLKVP